MTIQPDWSAWNLTPLYVEKTDEVVRVEADLPLLPGVYACLTSRNELLYVGKAKCLRQRWFCHHIAEKVVAAGMRKLLWLPCPQEGLDLLEGTLIRSLRPPLNETVPTFKKMNPNSFPELRRLLEEGVEQLTHEYIEQELHKEFLSGWFKRKVPSHLALRQEALAAIKFPSETPDPSARLMASTDSATSNR